MSSAGNTALAALQSSISIILIIGAGYVSRKYKLLDEIGESQISFLCNNLFLPLLLVSQVGPNFTSDSMDKVVPLFAFAAAEMLLGYLLGQLGRRYLKCPQWITPGLMFNNTTSLPLLLARNLDETGIMSQLLRDKKDTSSKALDRIESYILINAVFHTVLRFGLGPWLMKTEEKDHGASDPDRRQRGSQNGADDEDEEDEETSLLPHRRPTKVENARVRTVKQAFRWLYDKTKSWMNPALAGAIVAIVLGIIPFTHTQFFSSSGVFKKNIMQAVKQLGDLIPALLPFAVGSKLFSKPAKDAGYIAITYLIFIRFLLIPGLSILVVWLAKRHNTAFWLEDPAFDFALIISGAGPPAITLMSVAEIAGAEADMIGKVARTLLLSYAATPALSGTVVAGLAVIKVIYNER